MVSSCCSDPLPCQKPVGQTCDRYCQSRGCKFASWSIAPKPFLEEVLRATGGLLPALAPTLLETLQHLKQRGAVLHGDTVPCFMEQNCNVWTDHYRQSVSKTSSLGL